MKNRLFLLLCLACLPLPLSGKEKWRVVEADNVLICSNLPERKLKQLSEDIHYFNRSLEKVYQNKIKRMEEPLYALIVQNERQLKAYLGEDRKNLAGVFIGMEGMEMIVAQAAVSRDAGLSAVLFHEMTHSYFSSFNLPLWQNEGMAELFETVDISHGEVSIGLVNAPWINFHNRIPKFNLQDTESFLNTTTGSAYYRDSDTAVNFYSRAWLFAHYCLHGKPELTEPYLKLGKAWPIDESVFTSCFGFGYKELDNRLRTYARTGSYGYHKLKTKELPPVPPLRVRPATDEERITFETRAYCLSGQYEKAAELIQAHPYDNPLAIENQWLLAMHNEETDKAVALARKAADGGFANPSLSAFLAYRQFRDGMGWQGGQNPEMSVEQGRELMDLLRPALRTPGRYPSAVRTMILILDATRSAAPPKMLKVMQEWRQNERRTNREAFDAIDRIEARSNAAQSIHQPIRSK